MYIWQPSRWTQQFLHLIWCRWRMQSIDAISPYTWVDFQSFGFSSFAWFLLREVGAPWLKKLCYSYSQFLLVCFLKRFRLEGILNSQFDDLIFHRCSPSDKKGKEKINAPYVLVSLESVHYLSNKSGYRCLCNGSTAVNSFF